MARLTRTAAPFAAIALLAIASCGSSRDLSTSTVGAGATSIAEASGASAPGGRALATAQFSLRANNVCRAVRAGAPTRPKPPSEQEVLVRYAHAAEPAAKRTAASLPHVPIPRALRSRVHTLVADYQQLAGLYRVAATPSTYPKDPASLASAVKIAEDRAGIAALSVGARACAPHPQDASLIAAR